MTFHQSFFTHKGLCFSYLEGGAGPTIVFLPGIFLQASTYIHLLNLLKQHHHVIALDLPGFGQSDWPTKPWSADEYEQWFQTLVSAKKIHNATLVAHSYGCAIALAIHKNSAITKQILATPIKPSDRRYHRQFFGFVSTCLIKTYRELKTFRHDPTFQRINETATKNLARFFRRPWSYYQHVVTVYETIPSSTTKPSLLLTGSTDEFIQYNNAAYILKESACVRIVKMEGNHDFPLFNPQCLLRLL